MKKPLLIFIVIALLGGSTIWLMREGSGYLLLAVGNYTLEMSLWAAILLLVFIWLVLRGVRFLWLNLRNTGSQLVGGKWFDRSGKSRALTSQGMIELMEGRWGTARKKLLKAVDHTDEPLLNLLAAASASYELGEEDEVDRLLERATNLSGNDLVVDLVRSRLLIRKQNYIAARIILEKLHRNHPGNVLVLSMLAEAYQGLDEWQRAEALLPDLKRLKVFPKAYLQDLQKRINSELLSELAVEVVAKKTEEGVSRYRDYWNGLPNARRKDAAVQKAHIQCLYQMGEAEEAEKMLSKILSVNWDEDLVRLYGIIEGPEPATQLMTAEDWLVKHDKSDQLMVALSRLCQRNELWGKARDYLESALALAPQPEIYLDLAQLYARLGDHGKSAGHFKKGLLLAEKM